ncbi:MAG: cyclophilin-like fold protein [Nitrosopumilaceae archaeon]|nr:cyclophilin-like fold protein [Nitrosopumilaceae archaeon]
MAHIIRVEIPNLPEIKLELNEKDSPKTVEEFLKNLPFKVDLNVWGEEIYSSASPIDVPEENAKSPVSLNDVAYWPQGKAICLFYGPTPIGENGEIKPASPVNVIGKIINPDKTILSKAEGKSATFSKET